MHIPFNKPYLTGKEQTYLQEAHSRGQLAGDGHFTSACSNWIEKRTGCYKALLTHSCTAALEMAAILVDVQPGDEVIMPSFTFVSTANAFVLRGAVPVFVDIHSDTQNINESLIAAAITEKTKAIVVVHYAGVACEMDSIMKIAVEYNLFVIEDAAQAICSTYKGRALGTIGHLGCYSFHETKNIISGEGGALLINDKNLIDRAEFIREKGTNRSNFIRGLVDKYTWIDIGSSYLPGDMTAAFLWAQMQEADEIMEKRLRLWNAYHNAFETVEKKGWVRRPQIPADCSHNAHMYYLVFNSHQERTAFVGNMKQKEIGCVTHYIPLHSSPKGLECSRSISPMTQTLATANQIIRLPFWIGLEQHQQIVIKAICDFLAENSS